MTTRHAPASRPPAPRSLFHHSLPRLLLACALLLHLTGCALLFQRPPMPRNEFGLDPDYPERPPNPAAPALTVRLFEAAPAFENQEFLLRTSRSRWERDFSNTFVQPPATLVTGAVRRWMMQSGRFSNVAIPGLSEPGAWELTGYLGVIYADFQHPEAPQAVLGLRIALTPPEGGPPVLTKIYREQTPAKTPTPESLAEAWSRALTTILANMETDLARATAKPRPTPTAQQAAPPTPPNPPQQPPSAPDPTPPPPPSAEPAPSSPSRP